MIPWPPLRRAVLDAMKDGHPHRSDGLAKQLNRSRTSDVKAALNWLTRNGYATEEAGGNSVERPTYRLTANGLQHASNLDAGYGWHPENLSAPGRPPIATRYYDNRDGAPVLLEIDRPFRDDRNDCWTCFFHIAGLGRAPEPFDGFGIGDDSLEALVYALQVAESVLTDPRLDPPVTLHGQPDIRLPENPRKPLCRSGRPHLEPETAT